MVDISAIAGALSALKASKDIAEAMIGLRDAAVFQEKRLELQSKIMDAQGSVFAVNEERSSLLQRVSELEKEIAGLKAWDEEKKCYHLTDVGQGIVAYSLKEPMEQGEAPHHLCANCYQEHQKAFLQPIPISSGRCQILLCHRCGAVNYISGQAQHDHASIISKLSRNS
jgi:hypothetical protein